MPTRLGAGKPLAMDRQPRAGTRAGGGGFVGLQIGERRLQGHDAGEVGVGTGGVVHAIAAADHGLLCRAPGDAKARRESEAEGINERIGQAGCTAGLDLGDAGESAGGIGERPSRGGCPSRCRARRTRSGRRSSRSGWSACASRPARRVRRRCRADSSLRRRSRSKSPGEGRAENRRTTSRCRSR